MLDEQVGEHRRAMVVAGAVGVGKSRLLTSWLDGYEAEGRPVVVVRATRSTATVPFGAFARWVPDDLGDTRDRLGVLRATAARLVALGPGLVVAADDAQLLDDGSAALVLHLAEQGSAGVVVAVRSEEPCPDAVVALWKERLAVRLEVQPLSEREVAELLERVLGDRLTAPAQRRLWHLTEGNPLYLHEVVDAACAQGVLAPSPAGWQWHGPLAGHTRLFELVSGRIGASDPAERRALEIVALGEPLPTEVLGRLASREVLTRLENRGLIVGERSSSPDTGRMTRLMHPLYSEILRAELAPFTAQGHYLALVEAAIAVGVHERDPLRVAVWMLESGEVPSEPDLLMQASFVASVTADHELSARLAQAAEHANGGWRATLRRAEALAALSRWDQADALLAALSGPGSDPQAQAAAASLQADLSYWYRGEDESVARAILDGAIARVPRSARAPLLNQRAAGALVALELDEAIRLSTAAVADADTIAHRVTGLGCAALAAMHLGRTTAARAIVEMASPYALERFDTEPAAGSYLAATYSYALVFDGRIDEAVAVFELLLQHDVVRMGGAARALPDLWLARATLAQGRVGTAARLCREALDLLGDDNHFEAGTGVATTLATAAAQSGDAASAADAITWIDTHSRIAAQPDAMFADLARAWAHAARGETSAARQRALDVAARARAAGAWMVELLALLDLTRLGAPRLAAPRLGELTQLVEGPYAHAVATFAQAAATRDAAGLEEAAARFAAMGARLLGAEAAATASGIHAAAGRRRDHAASSTKARRLAAGCEGAATPLLARLADEPVVTVLTDREREVTELAARGRTSREIAKALTISVRTVHSHLNHAYTKLGITSRHDLADALGHTTRDGRAGSAVRDR